MTVAVAAQTPPPVGGQAVMVQALLDADLHHARLVHVPFRFSDSMRDMGRPGLGKLKALAQAVVGTLRARRRGAAYLYYCVAGAERFPLWRDAVFLAICRPLFRGTAYHFHAGGACEYLERAAGWERAVLRRCIGAPDVGIKLSQTSPQDPEYFGARRTVVVPNGLGALDSPQATHTPAAVTASGEVRLLSVGKLTASKGCFRLVSLVRELRAEGLDVAATLMGEPDGDETLTALHSQIKQWGLGDHVEVLGPVYGDEKWDQFSRATFLTFLSDFEHENVPLVIIEAMMFGLPVVASRWRGIPGLLQFGALGSLVDLDDPVAATTEIGRIVRDVDGARARAVLARDAWRAELTLAAFEEHMDNALALLDPAPSSSDRTPA